MNRQRATAAAEQEEAAVFVLIPKRKDFGEGYNEYASPASFKLWHASFEAAV